MRLFGMPRTPQCQMPRSLMMRGFIRPPSGLPGTGGGALTRKTGCLTLAVLDAVTHLVRRHPALAATRAAKLARNSTVPSAVLVRMCAHAVSRSGVCHCNDFFAGHFTSHAFAALDDAAADASCATCHASSFAMRLISGSEKFISIACLRLAAAVALVVR